MELGRDPRRPCRPRLPPGPRLFPLSLLVRQVPCRAPVPRPGLALVFSCLRALRGWRVCPSLSPSAPALIELVSPGREAQLGARCPGGRGRLGAAALTHRPGPAFGPGSHCRPGDPSRPPTLLREGGTWRG